MTSKRLLPLAVGVALAALELAGCAQTATSEPRPTSVAPTSASPTATVMPTTTATPTSALDADQSAALAAAEKYEAALAKIRSDPPGFGQYKMIELLKPLAFDDMIQANLNGIRPWRDNGWHEEGSQIIMSRQAGRPGTTSSGTLRIEITLCKDQRSLDVVNKEGEKVTAEAAQGPDFLQNTYDMRRLKAADSFKVYQFGGDEVEGCSS